MACSRASTAHRVQAGAARLPLADGCVDAVVIGDGPLFAAEAARVMTGGAVLVWSNALGEGAPFHVPSKARLTRADGRCSAHEASGVDDWRVVMNGACARVTPSVSVTSALGS